MKNLLVINGHPDKESFCNGIVETYIKGIKKSHHSYEQLTLEELNFNPNLKYGYRKRTELEPDLKDAQNKIKRADHIIWVFPIWWSGFPAIMKGFIDRVFLPGFAYEYLPNKTYPKKLLKGKSARIIVTSDTPKWYNSLFLKNPAINQLKKGTLQFCGISKVKVTYISPIRQTNNDQRKKYLNEIIKLGVEGV